MSHPISVNSNILFFNSWLNLKTAKSKTRAFTFKVIRLNRFKNPITNFLQYVIRAGQVVCMDDYEKEYFMVQGFAAAAGSGPGGPGSLLPGAPSSEFSQDGSQGKGNFSFIEVIVDRQGYLTKFSI